MSQARDRAPVHVRLLTAHGTVRADKRGAAIGAAGRRCALLCEVRGGVFQPRGRSGLQNCFHVAHSPAGL